MDNRKEDNAYEQVMEIIIDQGMDGMGKAMTILMNEAMKAERAHILQAKAYERTPDRMGYANGYKPKKVKSRLGKMDLLIPQVRGNVEFYPSALEKGERSGSAPDKSGITFCRITDIGTVAVAEYAASPGAGFIFKCVADLHPKSDSL